QREAAPGSDEVAERREFHARVLAAIEDLGPAYRQVLVLHLVHGLQAAQIAAALGVPAGTVRSRIARGLARLREALPAHVAVAWIDTPAGTGTGARDALREAVLTAGARAVTPHGSPSIGGWLGPPAFRTATGVILMKKSQIVAAAGIALLAGTLGTAALVGFGRAAPEPSASGAAVPSTALP